MAKSGGRLELFKYVPPTLGRIQGRVDDNPVESKRIELFPLPKAANQPKVRVRFGHAGTDSWYFGVDDFGLYSIPDSTNTGLGLAVTRDATGLSLSWSSDVAGVVLETSASLNPASWTPVGGVAGNSHHVAPSEASGYFRLRK